MMEKQNLLYEGKAKRIYQTNEANVLWLEYKNAATAFNGEKKAEISGKGQLNNEISTLIFEYLQNQGISSHFIKKISAHEQLVKPVSIIPLEVVVRNVVAGSMSKRLGIAEGTPIERPLVEFYYKDDALGDPMITEDHIKLLNLATTSEVATLKEQARQINDQLIKLFQSCNVRLVDFKIEFGKTTDGEILLADEISPDTCRLWDSETNQKLDKDVFRRDLGELTVGYKEILHRLRGEKANV